MTNKKIEDIFIEFENGEFFLKDNCGTTFAKLIKSKFPATLEEFISAIPKDGCAQIVHVCQSGKEEYQKEYHLVIKMVREQSYKHMYPNILVLDVKSTDNRYHPKGDLLVREK